MGLLLDLLLLPFGDTPAEKARKEGRLIYNDDADQWINLDAEGEAAAIGCPCNRVGCSGEIKTDETTCGDDDCDELHESIICDVCGRHFGWV